MCLLYPLALTLRDEHRNTVPLTSFLFLLKRDIDLWNRCSHLVWLERVLGKPTCDGLGSPFPIEPGTALGTDHHNQTEFERNVLQNSAIALGERAGLEGVASGFDN